MIDSRSANPTGLDAEDSFSSTLLRARCGWHVESVRLGDVTELEEFRADDASCRFVVFDCLCQKYSSMWSSSTGAKVIVCAGVFDRWIFPLMNAHLRGVKAQAWAMSLRASSLPTLLRLGLDLQASSFWLPLLRGIRVLRPGTEERVLEHRGIHCFVPGSYAL